MRRLRGLCAAAVLVGSIAVASPAAATHCTGKPTVWVDCASEAYQACLAGDPLLMPECAERAYSEWCAETVCRIAQTVYDRIFVILAECQENPKWCGPLGG